MSFEAREAMRNEHSNHSTPLDDLAHLEFDGYVYRKDNMIAQTQQSESELDTMQVHMSHSAESEPLERPSISKRRCPADSSGNDTGIPIAVKKKRSTSKWPPHIQNAFNEAAGIIPKNSIKTMQICGSIYGRNQYISFYIKDKTGETRTSKQISSRLQALCSSNKSEIKTLLINGPGESEEICLNFKNIFTRIVAKLLQQTSLHFKRAPADLIAPVTTYNSSNNHFDMADWTLKNPIKLSFKKFDMSYINFNLVNDSHLFSTFANSMNDAIPQKCMSRTEIELTYPLICKYFSILYDPENYQTPSTEIKFPVMEGNVSMTLPPLTNDLITGSYNLTTKMMLSGLPREDKTYGMITLISSNKLCIQETFQKLELLSCKHKNEAIFNVEIGSDYWKQYILKKQKEMNYNGSHHIRCDEETFQMEINGLQIQQFIIQYDHNSSVVPTLLTLDPSKIRSIFIWKFKKVLNQTDAVTTFHRISAIYNPITTTPVKCCKPIQSHNSKPRELDVKLESPLSIVAEKQRLNMMQPCTNTNYTSPPMSNYHGSPVNSRQIGQSFSNIPTYLHNNSIPPNIPTLITPPPCEFNKHKENTSPIPPKQPAAKIDDAINYLANESIIRQIDDLFASSFDIQHPDICTSLSNINYQNSNSGCDNLQTHVGNSESEHYTLPDIFGINEFSNTSSGLFTNIDENETQSEFE